ncbi:hypothetical protein C8R45DRAFT_359051 [Mycena sanguinolenta]|nr:hypothetical protein C8R45DRAFT_359051 [Mycena sanguinolenta]
MFRSKARAAAATFGSEEETVAFVNGLPDVDPRHLPHLMPVVYIGLSTSPIRQILPRFDSSGWASIKGDIARVHSSMYGLMYLGVSQLINPGARVHLWERLWPWIRFLDEYEESLRGDDLLPVTMRYVRFVTVIRLLHVDESTKQLIDSSPGLYVVLGRAWRHLISVNPDGMAHVSYFLGTLFQHTNWNLATFDELIVGTGGTRMDLASIAVSHLQDVIPSPDCPVTDEIASSLFGVLHIVSNHKDTQFEDALVSSGIIASLTVASRALCGKALLAATVHLKICFGSLVSKIASAPLICLPQSLRAGLLEILFTSQAVSPLLISLLKDVIAPASVYHSVLIQLRTSLQQVRDRDAATIFADATLLAQWESLLELVERRLWILEEYNNGSLAPERRCDHLECTKICAKRELKRCGGCLTTCYCSRACQVRDWRRGEHRRACGDLSSRRKRFYSSYSSRDRSFLRALFWYEYTTRQNDVSQRRLLFAQKYPDEIHCMLLDFTVPSCNILVGSVEKLRSGFASEVEQATKSGGQVQLHFMKVLYGEHGVPRLWPFLVRLEG